MKLAFYCSKCGGGDKVSECDSSTPMGEAIHAHYGSVHGWTIEQAKECDYDHFYTAMNSSGSKKPQIWRIIHMDKEIGIFVELQG